MDNIVFLTITFGRDIEKFRVLRKSIELFAPQFHHVVIVDDEDINVFQVKFKNNNLQFLPISDFLSPDLKRWRRQLRGVRRYVLDRIYWRTGKFLFRTNGWLVQQLAKISFISSCEHENIVFIDSDIFFTSEINNSDLIDKGKLIMLETSAKTYLDNYFEIENSKFLKLDRNIYYHGFNYIHGCPRFRSETGRLLVDKLRNIYSDWQKEFCNYAYLSEYNLLGWIAKNEQNYAGYTRRLEPIDEWGYNVFYPGDLDPMLDLCEREYGVRKFFLIQSNMRIDETLYLPRVEAMIERFSRSM